MLAVGVQPRFTPVPTPTRRCLNIIDPLGQCSTEILEQGYPLAAQHFEPILDLVRELAPEVKIICASGSVPPGLGPDVYARLGRLARDLDLPFIMDARGKHFCEGLRSKPFVIKPNLSELEQWYGTELGSTGQIIQALAQLNRQGVHLAIVSLGDQGAIATSQGQAWQVRPQKIREVNPVGSGDAFTAGLAVSLLRNLPLEEGLRLATACGTANAIHPDTGHIQPNQVMTLLPQTEILYLGGL
jgi:tagatose 6-phosphate kinase